MSTPLDASPDVTWEGREWPSPKAKHAMSQTGDGSLFGGGAVEVLEVEPDDALSSGTTPGSRSMLHPSRGDQQLATTEWSAIFGGLFTRFEAFGRGEWRPECFGEIIRDLIQPKCLALFEGATTSLDLQPVWARGFDFPCERTLPMREDPLSWLGRATGQPLFGHRAQAFVTSFEVGREQVASLCVVCRRRGRALVMERTFVIAAGALFGRMSAPAEKPPSGLEPAPRPALPARGGRVGRPPGPRACS